jgi:DNA-binding CsgD family transcriptional regulator
VGSRGYVGSLSSRDALAALRFSREASSHPDLESFRSGVLEGLGRLVPCDLAGYNEVDLASGTSIVITDPAGALFEGVEEGLTRLAHQHPLIGLQTAGDMTTHTISEFLSVRRFHALELYHDLYRRVGAEDQIAFGLPGRVVVGIAMNRSRRSFTDRDRAVLEAIRPNLTHAWRQTRARERARVLIAALEDGLEAAGGAIVLAGPDGVISDASDGARQLLEAYSGSTRWPARLPEPVAEWLPTGAPGSSLALEGPRGRLLVQRLGSQPGAPITLLLSESRPARPTVEALRELGLTRRQAEILCLAAAGRGTAEIGDDLGISVATVRKHLERVYERLGVHSRAEAIGFALGTGPRVRQMPY